MIKLVAFDLDDTLYPEPQYVMSGFQAVAEYLKKHLKTNRDFFALLKDAFEAGVRGNTFNHVLEQVGVDANDELIQDLVDVYRNHEPTIRPYDDVMPTLETLKGKYRLGLISDGPLMSQRQKWAALGISRFFDKVTFTDEMGPEFWKPNPRAFQEMAEHFGLSAEQCVYVADNPGKDMEGPARAGWRKVLVRRPGGLYGKAAWQKDYSPDFSSAGLNDFLAWLGSARK